MAGARPATVQRDLGNLFDVGSLIGLNDRELIDRFRDSRDGTSEAAFSLLLARHGPMVQRVCRNALSRQEDVEDAFQATFLILVQQSRSIRKLDSVASWLYGVAARVAARARVDSARRRRLEGGSPRLAVETVSPDDSVGAHEREAFGPVVQLEVSRLPGKYREVVLLCYWEGLTQEQAAHQLGCPIGTVRSRVARARDILRKRLTQRGLAPALLIFQSTVRPSSAALPAVPDSLAHSTLITSMKVGAGRSPADAAPGAVAGLVQYILRRMFMMQLRNVVVVATLSCVMVLGAGLMAAQRPERPERPRSPERKPAEKAEAKPAPTINRSQFAHIIEPPDMLLVEVLEALPGRPISGERLVRPDGTITLGFYGDVEVAGLTLPEAKAKIINHLRKFLTDETLRLVEIDSETGGAKRNDQGDIVRIEPADSGGVFVDITAYNSKFFFVNGWVNSSTPARIPITGGDTVLDALSYVGGLAQGADPANIYVLRSFPKGSPVQKLPVDYDQITGGIDLSTNYQLVPGDRIVVPRARNAEQGASSTPRSNHPVQLPEELRSSIYFNRGGEEDDRARVASDVERRLTKIEEKLDFLLNQMSHGDDDPESGQKTRKRPLPETPRRNAGASERH